MVLTVKDNYSHPYLYIQKEIKWLLGIFSHLPDDYLDCEYINTTYLNNLGDIVLINKLLTYLYKDKYLNLCNGCHEIYKITDKGKEFLKELE